MKNNLMIFMVLLLGSWNLFAQNNAGDLYPKDSIFFETNSIPYLIDPSQPANCWQVGVPGKIYFNGAYSVPLAIVTDTILPYPVNSESSFSFMITDSVFGDPPCGGATYFQFNHKYDTDTIQDYGYVDYSFDLGNTWYIARDTATQNGPWGFMMFGWDTDHSLTSGQYTYHTDYISGRSDGWIQSRFTWQWFFPVKDTFNQFLDTILVRFNFHSDDVQTNKEGWMIDNIITGCRDVGSGIPDKAGRASVQVCPNPVSTTSTVRWENIIPGSFFEVYDLPGRLILRKEMGREKSLSLFRGEFNQGIYIWAVKTANRTVSSGKLVVE
jgi:hypothetical protein